VLTPNLTSLVYLFSSEPQYVDANGAVFGRCVAGADGAWFILTTTPTQQHRKVKHVRSSYDLTRAWQFHWLDTAIWSCLSTSTMKCSKKIH